MYREAIYQVKTRGRTSRPIAIDWPTRIRETYCVCLFSFQGVACTSSPLFLFFFVCSSPSALVGMRLASAQVLNAVGGNLFRSLFFQFYLSLSFSSSQGWFETLKKNKQMNVYKYRPPPDAYWESISTGFLPYYFIYPRWLLRCAEALNSRAALNRVGMERWFAWMMLSFLATHTHFACQHITRQYDRTPGLSQGHVEKQKLKLFRHFAQG